MPADQARRSPYFGTVLLTVLLASCTPSVRDKAVPEAAHAPNTAGVCRVGPDGGPMPQIFGHGLTDRGIGGTGAAVRQAGRNAEGIGAAAAQSADRGIGGTGAPVRQAEQGIGGTGIVAVITGFASVCLAGQEVALDPRVPVLVGDRPAAPEALRVGQVAVIDAAGTGRALRARAISVRYEVSGPVEQADGASLRVAGQQVAVSIETLGDRPAPGEWVAVSGLRRRDGVIEATRLDRRPAGEIIVHGRLVRVGGLWRIGTLPIYLMPNAPAMDGQDVTVLGGLDSGVLQAEQLAPDLLASNPAALFGVGVQGLLIETFARVEGERLRFGQGFSAAAPGLEAVGTGRSVLALRRDAGGLRAVGVETSSPAGPAARGSAAPVPARQFEPAPVPNRALGSPGSPGRAGNGRAGGPGGHPGVRPQPGDSVHMGEEPGSGANPSAANGPGFGPASGNGPSGGPGRGR